VAKETWAQYTEHVTYFFQANGITHKRKQKAILLETIGPSACKLLCSLIALTKPDEKSYEELVAAMEKHRNPSPSETIQRYKFNSQFRKEGESVATYLSELHSLAEYCNFQDNLDDVLHDCLVCGIQNMSIQKRLSLEATLTLKKATEISLQWNSREEH